MEDMHMHLKKGVTDISIMQKYVEKCKEMKLNRVLFLDHGNRMSPKHNSVLNENKVIDKFFENSLNVSETSRQLYIHRNTLVYRLDKLQKSTGLDLRIFDDAITFKIALMVVKYMKYMESKDTF